MRNFRMLLLVSTLGAAVTLPGAAALAGKKKGGGEAAAPKANVAEVNKLKAVRFGDPKAGTFKWGMKPEEVQQLVRVQVQKKYEARIKQAAQDPGKQQRIRDEQEREIAAMKKSYTKFEGTKTGWDVSIIGVEFEQNTGEAVLVTKEEMWTRYFFFFEDGLYKMFLAFNKDALGDKSFQEFGRDREGIYGRAKEVYRDDKVKGGVKHVLDHFEWSAGGDRLRLVDRSEFYGVYCLVLADGDAARRLAERRKVVNPAGEKHNSLVESVTAKDDNNRDSNDNIVDRLTGHEVKRPGDEEKHADIVVPSPTKAPTAAETNAKVPASASSPAPEKETPSKKKGGKKNELEGLEL
jgi:hypothetical protein